MDIKQVLAALAEFSKSRNMVKGKELHATLLDTGQASLACVATTLVHMYGKFGCMSRAQSVFDEIQHPTVVAWNALMFGYLDNGTGQNVLRLFSRMQDEGCAPNSLSFVAALKACAAQRQESMLVNGRAIHAKAVEGSVDLDYRVATTLMDMYGKLASLTDACRVFCLTHRVTVASWNALVLAHAENGEGHGALILFSCMIQEAYLPDTRTYVAALKSCAVLASKVKEKQAKMAVQEKGMAIHCLAMSSGSLPAVHVENMVMDMYAKCNDMICARRIFDVMRFRDVVCWNAMISGYAENGDGHAAMETFSRMDSSPDARTLSAVLKACGLLGALEMGRKLHAVMLARGFEDDQLLVTSLLNFYGECGSMGEAQHVFDTLGRGTKRVPTWNALISGYCQQGDIDRALDLFQQMEAQCVRPNAVTLRCVLTACSHAGLIEIGQKYFEAMTDKYGIEPEVEHYMCMVDLYCRASEPERALALLNGMLFKPDDVAWTTILDAKDVLRVRGQT